MSTTQRSDKPALLKRMSDEADLWPPLPLGEWKDTYATLHMWTQIVGKLRMAASPHRNHWWETALYVSARGLTTSPIPYGGNVFEIEFDFLEHNLAIRTSSRIVKYLPLYPRSVKDFYREIMAVMHAIGINLAIWPTPVEVPDPVPFPEDEQHAAYDPEYVERLHKILLVSDAIFKKFGGRFLGKMSPVHFFWGSFDLAVSRFSGRRAPRREGADAITRDAYSHEVASAGFWPGGGAVSGPAFYAYTAPEPAGYREYAIQPDPAFYQEGMGEYLLMYDDVRNSPSPSDAVLAFLQSTYEAGANLAGWDRAALEYPKET